MPESSKKPYIIIGAILVLVLVGYITYLSATNSTSDVSDSEDIVSVETSTLEKDAIKDVVISSLGQKGYPERYTYDRPVEVTEYKRHDDGWITARVEILDEPPQSGYRYLIYIIHKTDDGYKPIASSQFETEGMDIPSDIPEDVMKDFLGSHD